MSEQQLQVMDQQSLVLAPLTPAEAAKTMEMYQAYVDALIDKNTDIQNIQGKEFKKKSAWRKLAMAMNLSVRIVSERREDLPEGDYAYHFVCEATHPNGRVTTGSGSCTAKEKSGRTNSLHNVRSTAETRAWNRAVSNMIAAGEVSAEEADQEYHYETPKEVKATKYTTGVYGQCPTCPDHGPGEQVEGIGKNGKQYKAFQCTLEPRKHFYFENQPEYAKAFAVTAESSSALTPDDIPFN